MKDWFLIFFVIILCQAGYIYIHKCDCEDSVIAPSKEIKRIDTLIDKQEAHINIRQQKDKKKAKNIKQREQSDTINVKLAFDSTATKDTIYVELIKCDSIATERLETISELNSLVSDKDSTIADKDSVVTLEVKKQDQLAKLAEQERKESKRQHRKAVVAKAGGFLSIVGTGIALINPIGGVAVIATGGTLLIVSCIKKRKFN